jgi:hypothetical protein
MGLLSVAFSEVSQYCNRGSSNISRRIKLAAILPLEWQVQIQAKRGKELKDETL